MSSLAEDFAGFWADYPRKVGKLAAEREYAKHWRRVGPQEIRDGLLRYRQRLPDDAQFIPHARTWLFHGRWMDEEDEPGPVKATYSCPHDPPCESRLKEWCLTRQWSEKQRQEAS